MTQTYKTSILIGILAGYSLLGLVLFVFHEDPSGVLGDLVPFFAVGASGLTLLLLAPDKPAKDATEPQSIWQTILGCHQNLSGIQMAGFGLAGFFLGFLLSKTVKLLF